jgi:preprotein translocase subunit Sec61beta
MAAKNKGGRLVSSAGLVTYYDSEDKRAIHLSPKTVLIVTAIIGIVLGGLDISYKMGLF